MLAEGREQVVEFDRWNMFETGLDAQKDGGCVHVRWLKIDVGSGHAGALRFSGGGRAERPIA